MPKQDKPSITLRAYTLLLRGADPSDNSWRKALWQTHEGINRGAKAFGDWLLTLRGGLNHTLADTKVKGRKGKLDRDPTDEERKARRILLALSWLSVESKLGAPAKFIIASDQDAAEDRNGKVVAVLEEILKTRKVDQNEINAWKNDCSPSLSAAIREDAVWVNRSKAFDEACNGQDKQQGREDARTLLWYLLTDDYLKLPSKAEEKQSEPLDQEEEEPDSEEIAEAVGKSGKGAGQRTRHPFSHIFGKKDTKGFGNPVRNLTLRDHWQKHLKPLVETAGIPLSDPNTTIHKGEPPSPTELHREMFSKAAARLAQIWTKQKQQELERERRARAVDELERLEQDNSYRDALNRLDTFCQERGGSTGSREQYRINPRAIEGWDRVIAAWDRVTETDPAKAADMRISEAKRLQDEDPDKKLGDINLFVSLAEIEYEPVWRHNGQAIRSILETYVKGWKARTDAVRLKVAAFRHPDPCFHPVFCQFGVSRPPIRYSRLDENRQDDARRVQMRLWSGSRAMDAILLAVSNRFDEEIGSIESPTTGTSSSVLEVARRSRLGIAAVAGADEDTVFRVAHVFDEQKVRSHKMTDDDNANNEAGGDEAQSGKRKKPSWNGTLQADRRELKAIGRMDSARADKAKQRLRWWLTISLELQQKGPWYAFIKNSSDKTAFTRIYKSGKNKGTEYVSQDGWPHERANDIRKGQARLILSRLHSLRVLSVDLGHRYAAACAVWEAVNAKQVKEACQAAGHEEPKESDLYLHLKRKSPKQKKSNQVVVEKTTIYRRIGADTLPDGTPHPAPWARLDRQFLIKLQGEEEGARAASNEEIWAVHQLETALGRPGPLIDRLVASGWGGSDKQKARLEGLKQLGWMPAEKSESGDESDAGEESNVYRPLLSVDELMSSAVRTMRLALKRHGDRARIALYLITDEKTKPGGMKEELDEKGRIDLLQDALVMWHDLFSSRGWRDDEAKQLWDEYIAKLSGYKALEEIGQASSGPESRKSQKKNREKLCDVAKALAQDATLRQTLHDAWNKRWEDDDGEPAEVDRKTGHKLKNGTGWHARLRWFQNWIMPPKSQEQKSIRKVGGLSLTRLATLTEFRRKVQVGFFTRLHPDGTKTKTGEQFGQSALDVLEHLREQRVKQLASRVAEAALGIGRMKRPMGGNGPKRPEARMDEPCQAIVIEDLTRYRPQETRTRRENRQLMTWSSSRVKKYLSEACQLHGLHLREVWAGYTSRQDSRTGAPGVRCQDAPIKEFMQLPLWRKQVTQAEKKQAEGKGDARERFLCDLNAKWKDKSEADWEKAGVVRVPLRGGEIFVSSDENSPAAKGLQADLNAAANIGLRALTDPDWPGKWWYVPCDRASFRPIKDKVYGSAAVNPDRALRQPAQASSGDPAKDKKRRGNKGAGKSKEIVNLWCDISSSPLECSGEWREYAAYQNDVQCLVVGVLEKQIKGRDKQPHDGCKEDDIPF